MCCYAAQLARGIVPLAGIFLTIIVEPKYQKQEPAKTKSTARIQIYEETDEFKQRASNLTLSAH